MECSICIQSMGPGSYTTTVCGHSFHKNCLCSWFNARLDEPATCPLCRADIKYDKGVIKYWDTDKKKLKLIQNQDGDYFFYPDTSRRKYFLKIDRKQNNKIIGGVLYARFRFEKNIHISEEFINLHYNKLLKLQSDDNYDIFDDL